MEGLCGFWAGVGWGWAGWTTPQVLQKNELVFFWGFWKMKHGGFETWCVLFLLERLPGLLERLPAYKAFFASLVFGLQLLQLGVCRNDFTPMTKPSHGQVLGSANCVAPCIACV